MNVKGCVKIKEEIPVNKNNSNCAALTSLGYLKGKSKAVKNSDENLKKIKIIRIVSRLNIGGPSVHCSILSKGLNNKQFQSKLVAGSISRDEGDMSYLINANGLLIKIPELQREINFLKDIKAFLKITRIIFREKPDIVHTHMAKAGAISRASVFVCNLVFNRKIKTVHTYHGHVLSDYFGPLKSWFFIWVEKVLSKSTDAIISLSSTQKWELSKKYKLTSDDKIHTINLGFDLTRFVNTNEKGLIRKSLGLNDKTILIGIVGRLVPIKNHFLFLDSAKKIKEKYPDKPIKFLIVGDGELRYQLEAYAFDSGIRDSVIFYGWAKKMEDIYTDIDILLLTSNNEGTPVSIIEAMASSVPVITTGVGGVKDLLGNIEKKCFDDTVKICERGILCQKGNAEAIASGVECVFNNTDDNDKRVAFAKQFVFDNYTDKKLIGRIENLYKSLM
ncbi:MAG: glycosyltransferase family 4 protein [Desulfobacteraceae bacterium]|nr:glycosyltransferase family 4 protein [Desulfobacteraceae bacterium]